MQQTISCEKNIFFLMKSMFSQIDTGVGEDEKSPPDSMDTDPSPVTQQQQEGMGGATQPGMGQTTQPSQQAGQAGMGVPALSQSQPVMSPVPALQNQGNIMFPGGFSTNVLPPPGSQPPQVCNIKC